MLTHKQRIIQSIKRDANQLTFTSEMSRTVAGHLRVPESDLARRLDNHIIAVLPDDTVRIDEEEGIRYDHWGIGWDTKLTEGFLIRVIWLKRL